MNTTVWPVKPARIEQPKLCEKFELVRDVRSLKTDTFFTVYKVEASGHYIVAFRGANMALWKNILTGYACEIIYFFSL